MRQDDGLILFASDLPQKQIKKAPDFYTAQKFNMYT